MTKHGFDYVDRRPEHVTRDHVVRAWQALDALADERGLPATQRGTPEELADEESERGRGEP